MKGFIGRYRYAVIFLGVVIMASAGFGESNKPRLPPPPDSIKAPSKTKTTKSRLSFGQTTFSFGQVPRKTVLSHAFGYGVSVVDTVRILRSTSSCGCTFAKVPEKPLLPKDTGSIVVTYTTGIVEGPFSKTFTLYTNSETTPEITLTIEGTVIRDINIDPPVVHLDEIQLGGGWRRDIAVHWLRWRKAGLKKPLKAPECFFVGTPLQDKGDTTLWRIPVTLSPKVKAQYYQDTLAIPTADTAWPQIKIPVQGTIADIVTTKPLVVNMGQVKKGQTINNSFVVASSVPGAKVEKVSSTKACIAVSIGKTDESGKITRINLSTTGNSQPGSIGTDVLVTVDVNGTKRELKVPVVGRFVE